jgi:hypothetical protein
MKAWQYGLQYTFRFNESDLQNLEKLVGNLAGGNLHAEALEESTKALFHEMVVHSRVRTGTLKSSWRHATTKPAGNGWHAVGRVSNPTIQAKVQELGWRLRNGMYRDGDNIYQRYGKPLMTDTYMAAIRHRINGLKHGINE